MLNTPQYWISQHQRLSELRIKLLRLHKLLLDTELLTYEQVRGQVSRGELLQLAIGHEQFAWLHRLSASIVQIDELLHTDEPVTPEVIEAINSDIRTLLSPDELGDEFAMKYHTALQRHPDVVLAHADVVMLLTSDSI
ncbi:hypothetical protein [Gloeocapsopsis dulcis]|uniref:Uncharacterized protein n=1 Tax=Gloeocapsopsis dulcis AAB1 = 1H9 TaxID=1433147 RepID=A0A6N8G0E2_9CHRO|nr:hypothetical protein [Gloeocapsopsis dulcis]MUL38803.1 hypothetical protein [Gloeocapsopsis dulcis AAB1 = 1H9]WNN92212.1 hypothetical protein P0S91_26970 [Gloeocapsopsis dulcis]